MAKASHHIVMSDSHGISLIVEEIRDRYLGKLVHFSDGDSELRQTLRSGEGIHVVKGNMDFYVLSRTFGDSTRSGPSRPMDTCLISNFFLFKKLDYWAQEERSGYLSLWSLACAKCLDGRQNTLFKSRPHQQQEEPSGMPLCPCGD